jgi:ribosomal protein L29
MTKSSPIAELRRMSVTELRKELSLKSASYARHRIGITMQSEKNHAACRLMRRDIARMNMVLRDLEKNQKNPVKKAVEASSVSSDSSVSSGSSVKKPVKGVRSKSKKAA